MERYLKSLRPFILMGQYFFLFIINIAYGQTEFKLTANDAANWDNFGYSVSMHGDYAIVGAIQDKHSGINMAGSAYIFKHVGNNWIQEAKLIAADPVYDSKFGNRVDITEDYAIISAYGVSHSGFNYAGSAYIFKRDGSSWIQQAKLIDDEPGDYDFFGAKVAIEGEYAIIGNPDDDISGVTNAGSVYIYKYDGSSWILNAKLIAPALQANYNFGMSVAISGDYLVIGTTGDVYIYRHDAGNWIHETKLTEANGFGYSVAKSENYLISGALYDDPLGIWDAGSAYIFKRVGGNWIQDAKLIASDPGELDKFGASVAISGDYAIVGAPWDAHSGFSDAGSVYVFKRNESNWIEVVKLTASDAASGDYFGYENISIDGYNAIVGAQGNDEKGSNAGAAYVYFFGTQNQLPAADAGLDQTVECTSCCVTEVTLDGVGSTDPDGDQLIYTWSENGQIIAGPTSSCVSEVTLSIGSHTIILIVDDNNGGIDTDELIVNIVDTTPPAISGIIAPIDPNPFETEIVANSDFIDACGCPHIAFWNWGDDSDPSEGMITEPTETDLGYIVGSHTYATPGVYSIKLTLSDNNGNVSESVFRFVVIYNPNAGFVTGGGWINSPEGAYTSDPLLTGKANFGFVSKYNKGKTFPEGNTQFSFKVADLKFSSKSYDWLVIAGPNAKYKGLGEINGEGEYGFMLTAKDGQVNGDRGVDKFRIKIWEKTTEEIIYDNQLGDGDDAEATDLIEGGSIVIHSTPLSKQGGITEDHKNEEETQVIIPEKLALHQNYPNPFNPLTTISYSLPESGFVILKLYDMRGRELQTFVNEFQNADSYSVRFHASNLASGIYFYKLFFGNNFVETKKMVFMR